MCPAVLMGGLCRLTCSNCRVPSEAGDPLGMFRARLAGDQSITEALPVLTPRKHKCNPNPRSHCLNTRLGMAVDTNRLLHYCI